MKKATMTAIVNYLSNNLSYADENEKEFLQSTIDELNVELNRGAEKAQANRDLYDAAKEVVMSELGDTPVTIGELYDAIATKLPQGMTKGKLQYAVTRLWTDAIARIEGKVNTYRKA
jgi:hypothetical protein